MAGFRQFKEAIIRLLGGQKTPDGNIRRGLGNLIRGHRLGFFDGNGTLFTHFHATFAAKALFCVYRNGFFILHFKHFHGAHIDALFAANAFCLINDRVKSHLKRLLSIGSIRVDPIINIGYLIMGKGLYQIKHPVKR
jgi:hypothetical protein